MAIKSLELSNVGPFRPRVNSHHLSKSGSSSREPDVKINFDGQVNLFIGPNNVGKSTALQAVNLLAQPWTDIFRQRYLQYAGFPQKPDEATIAIEWHDGRNQHLRFQSDYGALSRIMEKMGFHNVNVDNDWAGKISCLGPNELAENCNYAEWERHKIDDFGYASFVTHTNYRLDILPNTENLAGFLSGNSEFDRDVANTIQGIITRITDGYPVEINNIRGYRGNWKVDADTIDGQVQVSDLSQGTQSILGWIIRLLVGFAERYSHDMRWRHRPGIFIIDDVDAHLHPSWQRRIIPALTENFPNVQIFASTHSPMMVAGLKKGQVHLLKRNETTGAVEWSRNERDIIGWTADEIYRTFMGIDDPTDELTVQRANRLRELRDKEARTEAEEDEMNALRRQVNEDLLAGGRINAQRERFDAIMQEYLRSRMSDLSQDGA